MTYEEYMRTLEEQVVNKRAKHFIRQEFENHIEEQAMYYETEGMDKESALKEAVRQMGDPVKTGQELNKIHRPKFPVCLFALAFTLTISGICMQGIIFSHGKTGQNFINAHDTWILLPNYLINTILYNSLGLILIIGILYFNYNYFVKYILGLYGMYLCAIIAGHYLIRSYGIYWTYNYFLWMVYPLLFAGLLYRFRNRGIKGIFLCECLTLLVFFVKIMFPGMAVFSGATMESWLVITIILFLAVYKEIFGTKNVKLFAAASLIVIPPVSFFLLSLLGKFPVYYMKRLTALLSFFSSANPEGEAFYLINHLRENISQYAFIGGHTLPDYINFTELYSNYMVTSVFSWFGIIPGLIILTLFALFCFHALRTSLRQNNRLGMMLGSACSISILVRILAYVLSNFGFGPYTTISIPFFTYGLLSSLINAVFVGIIMCVYRNSSILKEECF